MVVVRWPQKTAKDARGTARSRRAELGPDHLPLRVRAGVELPHTPDTDADMAVMAPVRMRCLNLNS